MVSNRSSLQTVKVLLICSFSILLLFLGFYKNYWGVANQQWFDGHQPDMESFIIGRMAKSHQDGIFSSGGLTGQGSLDSRVIYFDDPGDRSNQNQAHANDDLSSTIQDNQYLAYFNSLPFVTYTTYNSQIGGQGMFFGMLDRFTTFPPQEKFHLFQAFTSLLSALTLTAIVLWFYLEFGLTVALFVLASAVLSQWLVVFGRNLWWSMWSFYLPVAVMMYYLRFKRELLNIKPFTLGVTVFLTIFIKCLFTGYEYITTTLVMMTVPLIYYGVLKRWNFRKFFTGFFTAAFSSCLAILMTFIILCFQVASVKGSFRDGVNHIIYAFAARTYAQARDFSPEYTASLESGTAQVLIRYLRGTFFDAHQYLSFSNSFAHFASAYLLKWTYIRLIALFMMMSGLLYFFRNRCLSEEEKRKAFALILATWFSILAPLSWFVIFKSHSYIHTHMNFIIWQMPFVFFGFAVCGLAVKSLLPDDIRYSQLTTGNEPQREASAYVTSIDSLRAVAVLSVIIYHMHAAWLPGGFAGVDVFLVISGYVISRSMVSFADLGFTRFVGTFYSRRIRRIVPALIVCLLTTTLLATLFIPRAWLSDLNARTGRAAFWGVSNFTLMRASDNYFAPRLEFNPYTHTWSLGVEEQFYVLFPTLFYFWLRFRNSESHWRRPSRYLLALFFLASLCYSIYATRQTPVSAYYGLPSRFWELAAGALLFQFHHSGSRLAGRGSTTDKAQLGLSAGLMIGALCFSNEAGFPFPWAVPAVAGTLGALDLVTTNSAVAARTNSWLTWAPVVWVGKLSYSLYLWHWPVYVLARWTTGLETWSTRLAAIGATVLLSWASYVWVENPFRRGPLLHRVRPYAVIAGGLCCVFVAWRAAHLVDRERGRLSLSVTQKNSEEWYPDREPLAEGKILGGNCRTPELRLESIGDAAVTVFDHGNCNTAEHVKTVFVTGNSHALAYDTLLSRLARLEPFNVRVFYNGCVLLGLEAPMADDSPSCRRFYESVLVDIESRLRPGDVVFLPSLRLPRFVEQWVAFSEATARDEIFGRQAVDAREAALDEADRVLERLVRHGGVVIFEAPKPIFRAPAFRCSDWFNRGNPICVSGLKVSRDYLLQYREPVLDAMNRLSRRHEHVYVWDPFNTLCPTMTCEAVVNGSPLFLDGDHLSAHGNRVLYPEFVEFLRSHSEVERPGTRSYRSSTAQ